MRRDENAGVTVWMACFTDESSGAATRGCHARKSAGTTSSSSSAYSASASAASTCRLVRRLGAALDQPAVVAREPFRPPAVADAQVQRAVHRRLHAARAAGFERLARCVEPDVAALHEQVRHVQVVVIDERDAAGRAADRAPGGTRAADDACRLRRPGAPCRRTRIARDVGAVRRAAQPIDIAKHQIGPLVAGEPPGESNRQRGGIEHGARRRRRARRRPDRASSAGARARA